MCLKNTFLWALVSFFVLQGSQWSRAADFDYPELSMTPRASERIDTEAAKENGRRWTTHLPLQVSASMTFIAGLSHLMSPNNTGINAAGNPDDRYRRDKTAQAWIAGVGVGGAWLALTTYLSLQYQPYQSVAKELSSMPKKTVREQLTRERYADEEIQYHGSLAKKLRFISFLSNVGTSAYLTAVAAPESSTQLLSAAAILASFAPWVFPSHWQDVADDQTDYKKRIYAPVASMTLLPDSEGRAVPGFQLAWGF